MEQNLLRTILLSLILLWSSISLYAQENSVQGLLMEKSGASRIANVIVLNKNSGIKVLSNELGLFRIRAVTGDTLSFSKAGFGELTQVLSSLSDLVLTMQPVIELAEVKSNRAK